MVPSGNNPVDVSPEVFGVVRAHLLDDVDDITYVSALELERKLDEDYSRTQLGLALAALAREDDDVLDVESWSSARTNRTKWMVQRREEREPVRELRADGGATTALKPIGHAGDFSRFQLEICYTLAAGELKGTEIKRRLEHVYGSAVNHGRLYPNLDALVDAGFVDKRALDNRTNGYSLSQKGHAVVQQDARRRDRIASDSNTNSNGGVESGDVGDDRDGGGEEPTRSEPADFGGGESTGVQDL